MNIENKEELQNLLNLNCRLVTVANLAAGYKNNTKAVKLCLKLAKLELKGLKKSSSSSYELREIQHRFTELAEILKRLSRSSSDGAANKAVEDLRILIEKTQEILNALNEKLNPVSENVRKLAATLDSAANKLSEKLGSGAQKLSEKVNEAVGGIKKKILNSDEEK